MLRFTFVASLVGSLLVAFSVSAGSSSMSPGQALARINSSGHLELCSKVSKPVFVEKQAVYTVQVPTTETRTRTKRVTVDGVEKEVEEQYEVTVTKPETRTMTTKVMEFVSETIIQSFPPGTNGFRREADKETIPLYDLAGNSLTVAAVEDRLEDWTLVLISPTGKPVDRRFAAVFKPTTLVIGVPPQAPSMPMPAPRPQPNQAPAPPAAANGGRMMAVPVAYLADEMPMLPDGPVPTFAFAKVWGDSVLALRTEETKTYKVSAIVRKTVDRVHEGKTVKATVGEPRMIEKTVETQETLRYALDDVSVTRANGKEVDTPALPTILAYESLAMVSADGKPVDLLWQRNLREDVLVIVVPPVKDHIAAASYPPMPYAPMPMPSAPPPIPNPAAPQPAPPAAPVAPPKT